MHAFVDETKQNGLLIVSTLTEVRHIQQARKVLQAQRAKGQNRIHFKKEDDPRRRAICSALCTLEVQVFVYDATSIRSAVEARTSCLTALVEDLAAVGGRRFSLACWSGSPACRIAGRDACPYTPPYEFHRMKLAL